MRNTTITISAFIFFLYTTIAHGQIVELDPQQVNGLYELAIPERSPVGEIQQTLLQYGELNGKTVLVTKACPQCPPATYSYMPTESEELGTPIFFNSMGIYVFAYDMNTFVTIMADGQLGKKVWSKITYANVYSKTGTPTINLEEGQLFAIAESKRLMTGEGVIKFEVTGGSGTYYPAVMQSVGSDKYDQLDVTVDTKKTITLTGMKCSETNCRSETFKYETELSSAIGKNVYKTGNMGSFLVEQDKGVIWWTDVKLGKEEITQHNGFNVIAQDKTHARKLTLDKTSGERIANTLKDYAIKAKTAVDARYAEEDKQRTENNTLPKQGMKDSALEKDALIAAQDWAKSYSWKEELKYVYLAGRDWDILRNKLTGIQTGRRILGVIVMKREDGLCSYQKATFDQAYNDENYQKIVMSGVVPGQNKLDCDKI